MTTPVTSFTSNVSSSALVPDNLKVVMTGIGEDRYGLVAQLTKLILAHQGNIEDSTMTRLAGHFATILIVSLPSVQAKAAFLEAAREPHLQSELQLTVQEAMPSSSLANQASRPYLVSVAGRDKTGITHEVAQVLAQFEANITDLNAHRIEGEEGPVYVMVIEFDLPASQSYSALQQALDTMAQEMELDIRVRSIEAVAL